MARCSYHPRDAPAEAASGFTHMREVSAMSPLTAPVAELIDEQLVANLLLIHIAVKNNELYVHPRRAAEAMVFHVSDPAKCSPARPWAIRWFVTGLAAGQRIEITPKSSNGHKNMLHDKYVIAHPNNSILSGTPSQGSSGDELHWGYDLRLMDGTGQRYLIDPGIIIKDDP